jgi:hypothetical protein
VSNGSGADLNVAITSETTSLANPITHYYDKTTTYPANSQIWWAMKRPPELGTDAAPKTYLEVFDPGLRYQVAVGDSPAPKGHFVLDAFQQDRAAASSIVGLSVVSSGGYRPRCVAFYAGRVWYAGVQAQGFSSNLYFSPIIEKAEQVGNCFQQLDPTAEELRDLLPSDGGLIKITEATVIHHMQTMGENLLIFAENGVWAISGSEGTGFRANDFSVRKVSGVPAISNMSFVDVEGTPIWWNRSSINTITVGDQGGLVVQSLTDQTIQSFYDEIPEESKFYAKGAYDPLTKTIQYLYRTSTPQPVNDEIPEPDAVLMEDSGYVLTESSDHILLETETFSDVEQYVYDGILTFDTRTLAWAPWTVTLNFDVAMLGVFAITGKNSVLSNNRVLANFDVVQANADDVFVLQQELAEAQSKMKYVASVAYQGLTFGEEYREDYLDWVQVNGEGFDFTSYVITGYQVIAEGNRKFQNNYLTVNYENVTEGQAYVQGIWDWTASDTSGRWSMRQLIYRNNDVTNTHDTARVKIRGHGKSLQLKFESQTGKPFSINGWSMLITANSGV